MIIKPPVRRQDKWGSGEFQAPRGNRTHNGMDMACYKGSIILSAQDGVVTKIGYPYNPTDAKKGHLRYVEVTINGISLRYFYVKPLVSVGDVIQAGQEIGESQGLCEIYPGITDHVHVEARTEDDIYLNPFKYFMEYEG